jgi:hypothetical protein
MPFVSFKEAYADKRFNTKIVRIILPLLGVRASQVTLKIPYAPQQFLYFLPLPQGHGSLRPTFGILRTGLAFACAAAASLTTSLALFCGGAPGDPWAGADAPPPNALAL